MAGDAMKEADRWSTAFFRLVQVVGLLMVIVQATAVYLLDRKPEPWLLLVAVGMMLGGVGLRLMFRGATEILGDSK